MGFVLLDVYLSQGKSLEGMECRIATSLVVWSLIRLGCSLCFSQGKDLGFLSLQRQNYFIKDMRQKSPTTRSYIGVFPFGS